MFIEGVTIDSWYTASNIPREEVEEEGQVITTSSILTVAGADSKGETITLVNSPLNQTLTASSSTQSFTSISNNEEEALIQSGEW